MPKQQLLTVGHSQSNFNLKDRFAHTHGNGGFYRECISTGVDSTYSNGGGSLYSQWGQMISPNQTKSTADNTNEEIVKLHDRMKKSSIPLATGNIDYVKVQAASRT